MSDPSRDGPEATPTPHPETGRARSEIGPAEPHEAASETWVPDDRCAYLALVGPILARASSDEAIFAFRAEAKHANIGGVTHGGMLLSFLDTVMGRAARMASGDRTVVTVQLNTHFLSSVMPGDFVEGEARVVRAGRSLLFMQGTLRVGSRLIAAADGIWKPVGSPTRPEAVP